MRRGQDLTLTERNIGFTLPHLTLDVRRLMVTENLHKPAIVPPIFKYDLQTSIRVPPSTNTVAGCILVPSLSVLFYNTLISFSQKWDWIGASFVGSLSRSLLSLSRCASIDCFARLNLSVSRPFIIQATLLQVHAMIFGYVASSEYMYLPFFCMKFRRFDEDIGQTAFGGKSLCSHPLPIG